jgi:hypothetical protein
LSAAAAPIDNIDRLKAANAKAIVRVIGVSPLVDFQVLILFAAKMAFRSALLNPSDANIASLCSPCCGGGASTRGESWSQRNPALTMVTS